MSQLGDSQAGEVPSYSAFHASRPFNCLGEAHPHCRVQSDSYVNHIQKCPHRHTQNTVRPQSWAPCGPVKVTRKMSPHRQPAHRPSLDTVWALSCGYLDPMPVTTRGRQSCPSQPWLISAPVMMSAPPMANTAPSVRLPSPAHSGPPGDTPQPPGQSQWGHTLPELGSSEQ